MAHKKVEYRVNYRKIKYPRLEFKTGTLHLILPHEENPMDIIENHKNWIDRKENFIKKCLKDAKKKKIVVRTEEEFRNIVFNLVNKDSKRLRLKVGKVFFRKMQTKWASCSTKKNLTINTLMKYLPENLIEYIIYHELTHLLEKRHNERFWNLISNRFINYAELEKGLFSYWFLINKNPHNVGL